ncbi:MAG: hypothetical protein ACPGUU_01695 [Flavobacteriaceae bacterium]
MQKGIFLLLFLSSLLGFSQGRDSIHLKNGIENPSLLATHHFGIFSSRINPNFKIRPPKKSTLEISYTSGNIFQPFVEAHLPKDPQIRKALSNVVWFDRQFNFIDQQTTPADYMNIVVDAVIKEFRVNYTTRLTRNSELGITLRSYLITDGSYPFSFFASDESIEWFHSNIAGGEDPFGRRYYGLNQVNFKYTDRNGGVLELKENDFFIGGIETNYFYYPKLFKDDNLHTNFGVHLGVNTSKFNPSIDIGVSANTIKEWTLNNRDEFRFALGINLLHKNSINFDEVIELGNNRFLGTFEPQIEYTKYTRKKNYHSFSAHYQLQTRFRKKEEESYYRLLGKWQEINAGWHNGISTMYKNLTAWTFLYSYGTPKYKLSLFLKEDLLVHNAPDVQTGISLKIPISN